MHGERVDGNDVLAVLEAASRLLAQARDERRPALLETVTYRYRGHSVADAGKVYRTREEVQSWRERDPITRYGLLLGERGIATGADLEAVWEDVAAEVKDAISRGPGRLVPEPRRPLRPPLRRRGVARAVRADVDGCAVRRARRGARMADVTYREALRRALDEELERDRDVFLMGEEIGKFEGSYKVTAGLWEKYGADRVRETPISEEGFVGAGIGAAMMGLRPVVEIMTINFILVAMDQVVNHAAKIRYMFGGKVGVPLVIRTPGGAGAQLTAQHSQSLEGWFAGCPGPEGRRAVESGGRVRHAEDGDPRRRSGALLREPGAVQRHRTGAGRTATSPCRSGSRRSRSEGDDLTHRRPLLHRAAAPCGWPTGSARTASRSRWSTCARCDRSTSTRSSESVRKTNRVLVAEEGWSTFGVGAELAARIQRACFDDLDAPVERVGAAEVPMPYSKPLELAALPLESKIEAAARSPASGVRAVREAPMSEELTMPRLSDTMEEGTDRPAG